MTASIELFDHFWIGLQAGQLPPVGSWSYLLLALLVMIEGPMATLLGAAAASAGLMKPGLVFVAASAGNLTADSLWYSLGRAGKGEWLVRHGRWFGLHDGHLLRLEREMHAHSGKILLFAKLTAGLSVPALIAAGMARVPWKRSFSVLFIGECIWTGVLVLTGVYLTEALVHVERGLQVLAGTAVAAALVFAFVWFVRSRLRLRLAALAGECEPERQP